MTSYRRYDPEEEHGGRSHQWKSTKHKYLYYLLCLFIFPWIPAQAVWRHIWFPATRKLRVKQRDYPQPLEPRNQFLALLPPRNPLKWKRAVVNGARSKAPRLQEGSGFCRLPVEVRMMIYELVLGTDEVHVILNKQGLLYGFPCRHKLSDGARWAKKCQCRLGWDNGRRPRGRNKWWDYPRPGIGMMGLALTCRFM